MAEYDREIEDSFEKILFVPSAYKVRRGTAFKTPSSPSRGFRHTPGRTTSRTPPPPPLNHDDEPRAVAVSHGSSASTQKLGRRSERPGVTLTGLGGFASDPDRPIDRGDGEKWIKVCGVLEDDHQTILRHFRRYGQVEQYVRPDASIRSNYVYIQFKSPSAASSSLVSNGKTIDGRRCFGVVVPTDAERRWLHDRYGQPAPQSPALTLAHHDIGEMSGDASSRSIPVTIPSAPPEPATLPPVQSSGSTLFEYYMRFIFG